MGRVSLGVFGVSGRPGCVVVVVGRMVGLAVIEGRCVDCGAAVSGWGWWADLV